MCVAGEKSKFLVIGTKELRKKRCGERTLEIKVDGKVIKETKSEKLLGILINNNFTWKEHLYGETWRQCEKNQPGLIPQLSQRLGILKKISQTASKEKLRMIAQGIFYSKLGYCLPLFSNTWGLETYKDGNTRSTGFTKEDNRKLQVIQNQVVRLLVDKKDLEGKLNIPTKELLDMSNDLSIHQLGALRTVTMVKKIILTQKPKYLARRFQLREKNKNRSRTSLVSERVTLDLKREGFVYRGSRLFNILPEELKLENKIEVFKEKVEDWIKEIIPVKP